MSFDGFGPLLDADVPLESAEYVGPGSMSDPVNPGGILDLMRGCPGRSCLLRDMDHEHVVGGEQR